MPVETNAREGLQNDAGEGPPVPAPAAHPTPFLSRQAGMQMRGRGGYSLTSPTGKESARHFFSAIHQVQTGATSPSLFPEPTPGRTWKQDWAAWGSASWAGLPDPQGWAGVKKGRRARSRPVTLLSCAPCPPFLASVTFDLLREELAQPVLSLLSWARVALGRPDPGTAAWVTTADATCWWAPSSRQGEQRAPRSEQAGRGGRRGAVRPAGGGRPLRSP